MFKTTLTMQGFEEYLERIVQAGIDVDEAADRALASGGAVLVAGMQERVPKDTWNLEQHIICVPPVRDGNYHFVEVGVITPDPDTARYGNAQEYGSSSMPAQPYIRPTIDSDMGKAKRAMRAELSDILGPEA